MLALSSRDVPASSNYCQSGWYIRVLDPGAGVPEDCRPWISSAAAGQSVVLHPDNSTWRT